MGFGQSSWGPTGFIFAPSETVARQCVEAVGDDAHGTELRIVRGRNGGAEIETHDLGLVAN